MSYERDERDGPVIISAHTARVMLDVVRAGMREREMATKKKRPKQQPVKTTEPPPNLRGKVQLINAMVALRRYHDSVLLKDLSANGEVKVASREVAQALDLVLNVANRCVDDM